MKRLWTLEDLVEHRTLSPADLALLDGKTGPTRLGCAVLVKAAQCDGRFPTGKQDVPAPVIAFVARQLGVPAATFLEYDWRGRTIEYHRAQIRDYLGVRQATVADAEAVGAWLVAHALPPTTASTT